ncbi:glycerol dehydrogenase [Clostridium tetani]|uniref:Glycerol dehydrogenase n=1 Tax=Clostridium tetani TaxID=1513 RepID=A0ABC8E9B7_CLOTA|nr:glycerol dehydrogenase [Clostridium tetani]BDR80174.1 glycerol dehydrogenase [Clostridium tetani]BDR88623.1 glycerol dehydrogenase [Clostridium tetani]
MLKVMRTPSRYVQGSDSILDIYTHTSFLGDSYFIIADNIVIEMTKGKIEKAFENKNCNIVFENFNGQCTRKEINRLLDKIKENNCTIIVGVGGGRTLDTAKAIGHFGNLPVVIIPTVAATDAPCTALSVLYTEEGNFEEYLFYEKNPDVVLVDTTVIAKAPVRFMVAGMGDALATYFEARACLNSNSLNLVSGSISLAAYSLSKLCYETLLDYGYKAKLSVEDKVVTPSVEKIIEATTYLSGVGAENGGLAAAHSVYNAFTLLEECEKYMHGEIVAFGTLVQLVLEDSPMEEINEVASFCVTVNLPLTLAEIGINEINEEKLMKVAKAACAPGETIHNMLGGVTPEQLYNAILVANKLGLQYKNLC